MECANYRKHEVREETLGPKANCRMEQRTRIEKEPKQGQGQVQGQRIILTLNTTDK